jgi:putative hydrolase of the HAD superfamily
MIDTVVFDIGRVLIRFEWNEYIRKLFDEKTAEAVTEATFGSRWWNEMDRGVLDENQILEKFVENAPEYKPQIEEAFERVGECTIRADYAIPWVDSLKQRGYSVYYLSNYSEHVCSRSMHALDFLEHMDGGVFSYEVHSVKPEKEIYEALFSKYDLDPRRCVFVDDNPNNVEESEHLGMRAVLFRDHESASRELENILIEEGK